MSKNEKTATAANAVAELMSELQGAGLKSMPNFGSELMKNMTDLGSEMMNFTADRFKQDVQTQQALLNANSLGEIQQLQARFFKTAMDDYAAEATKLMAMSQVARGKPIKA